LQGTIDRDEVLRMLINATLPIAGELTPSYLSNATVLLDRIANTPNLTDEASKT
jgi:hypothetical protein